MDLQSTHDQGSTEFETSSSTGPIYSTVDPVFDIVPTTTTLKHLRDVKEIQTLKGYWDFESWKNNLFDTLQMNGSFQFFEQGERPPNDSEKATRWIQANSWIRQLLLWSISYELIKRLQLTRLTKFGEIYTKTKKHILAIGANCLSAIHYKWDHLKCSTFDDKVARIYELQCHL